MARQQAFVTRSSCSGDFVRLRSVPNQVGVNAARELTASRAGDSSRVSQRSRSTGMPFALAGGRRNAIGAAGVPTAWV